MLFHHNHLSRKKELEVVWYLHLEALKPELKKFSMQVRHNKINPPEILNSDYWDCASKKVKNSSIVKKSFTRFSQPKKKYRYIKSWLHRKQKCCHKCKQGHLDVTTYQFRFYKKKGLVYAYQKHTKINWRQKERII